MSVAPPRSNTGMQHAMGRNSDMDRRNALPASLSSSNVPASLGITASKPPTKSLRERLRLSASASYSSFSSRSKPNDGLRFSNANANADAEAESPGRSASDFGSFPSIPSWGPQSDNSFSHQSNGLSTSSSVGSLSTASTSSSSRNFLVPIGATGARQKLSIASASQRRRFAASEDAKWSADNSTSINGSQQNGRSQPSLQRSKSDFHNLAAMGSSSVPALNRSTSSSFYASSSGPTGSSSTAAVPNALPSANATPAELMQQAAMQRLSSQRMMPTYKNRSVSENIVTSRPPSSRPSLAPSTSSSSIVEHDLRSPQSYAPTSSAFETRSDVSSNSTSTTIHAPAVSVPDRTTSSLRPTSRPELPVTSSIDTNERDADRGIAAKPLTLAESYKRAMLERDVANVKAIDRAGPISPRTAPVALPPAATSTIAATSTTAAPLLDFDLPISSFFFDDDKSETNSALTAQPKSPPPVSNGDIVGPQARETNAQRIAALDSASPTQPGAEPKSLQRSYDEAMAIQDRIRGLGMNDEAAYGGLFGDDATSLPRSSKDSDLARSYLALRDDEDDTADRQQKLSQALQPSPMQPAQPSEPLPKSADVPSASPPQQPAPALPSSISRILSLPAPAPSQPPSSQAPQATQEAPQTPPADKSFVQFDTPEQEPLKPKSEAAPHDVSPTRIRDAPLTPVDTKEVEVDRPSLPREYSLQTLRSPPNKLEQSPGPEEEAALKAGATAALPTSPVVPYLEPNAATQPSASASPAINGERTIQAGDEESSTPNWRRSQDALAALSPMQQSRFSEASTDHTDSRAPTRNEIRYSGIASSISSADGLEEESSDGHMLPTSAWHEVENALRRFRDKNISAPADRGSLLRAVLLPFLALEAETAMVDVNGTGIYVQGKARRALFFDWIRSLLLELQHVQTSADRGAILESIACIIESRNFSASILSNDREDEARFSSVFGHILSYAIGELNKKGVYQNTLIFSGRLLAVAFFRVNGVASKLLRALPVNRFALERVAREFEWQKKRPTDFVKFANRFPATLRQLCYKDSRDYLKMLDSESIAGTGGQSNDDDRFLVCQPEVEVEMSGNWLRRWQSDDSELFFSFCRSYHRQLASLFASSKSLESVSKYFFGGPGYAHLATCVHQKCLALVHRVILSVTTLSSQKNFNPAGETANVLSGSTAGKPRILEAANRRCTAIVVDIVRAPAGANMIFAPMLGLHIKALIKRTSLYDVQGVFCLLDWLDGVLSHMDSNDLINEGLVDISFIITTIGMLLENADHALALMRTIAFCYANFGVLTATSENRILFCEQILLKPSVFHKLFLSWSFTIRAYYLHLLVFRLARIRDFPSPKDDPSGRTALRVVRLFNLRLETLRQKHNTLSPETDSSSDDTRSEDSKSRKSGTSTFVSTIKRASTDGGVSSEGSMEARPKAEKIMGMTAVDPIASPAAIKASDFKKGHSKTKSWLKAFRTAGKPELGKGAASPRNTGTPPNGRVVSAESDDDNKTIGSARTTPRTSFDSVSSDTMSDVSTLAGSIRGGRTSHGNAFEFDIKQQQAQQQQQQQQQQSRSSTSSNGSVAPLTPTPDAGIAKDTVFDLQSTQAHHPPTPGKTTLSPRISKAFARRGSMLPGPASELVANGMEGEEDEIPPVPDLPADHYGLGLTGMHKGGASNAEVYDDSLHIYAVQSLREYEQTVHEHDEFFQSLPEDQSTQVPRLPVNWPAMWSSTGE